MDSIGLDYHWDCREASGLNPDGTLKAGALKGAATDGTDLGVNFEALRSAVGSAPGK